MAFKGSTSFPQDNFRNLVSHFQGSGQIHFVGRTDRCQAVIRPWRSRPGTVSVHGFCSRGFPLRPQVVPCVQEVHMDKHGEYVTVARDRVYFPGFAKLLEEGF